MMFHRFPIDFSILFIHFSFNFHYFFGIDFRIDSWRNCWQYLLPKSSNITPKSIPESITIQHLSDFGLHFDRNGWPFGSIWVALGFTLLTLDAPLAHFDAFGHSFGSIWLLRVQSCLRWVPFWLHFDTFGYPFDPFWPHLVHMGALLAAFWYLRIPFWPHLVHMGAFLPHFLLLLNKIRSNLLIFEGFGVGGGEMHNFHTRFFSNTFLQHQINWLARCGIALQLAKTSFA